jgi:Mg-dependent DNase
MLCGIQPAEWSAIARAADAWPGTVPAFGVHPWNSADAIGDWLVRLRDLLGEYPHAWLGEIGLDYLKAPASSFARQREIFAAQLRIARELRRPLNIHCLKAQDDVARLLDAEYPSHGKGVCLIMHSLSASRDIVGAFSARGAFFTVGPLFSRKDSERHRQCAACIPEDRLLVESDAFVVPPVDAAADVLHTLRWLAGVRGVSVERMAHVVEENGRRIMDNDK